MVIASALPRAGRNDEARELYKQSISFGYGGTHQSGLQAPYVMLPRRYG